MEMKLLVKGIPVDVSFDYFAGCEGTWDSPKEYPKVEINEISIDGNDLTDYLTDSLLVEITSRLVEYMDLYKENEDDYED